MMMFVAQITYANDEKFIEVMKKNIDALCQAKDEASLQTAINAFDRIALRREDTMGTAVLCGLWKYNACFAGTGWSEERCIVGSGARPSKQGERDTPERFGTRCPRRICLHDPRYSRSSFPWTPVWRTFNADVCKANALNPENPRALALMAQMQFGTAQFFNQPTTDACNTLNQALQKFDTFKSDNPLALSGERDGLKV